MKNLKYVVLVADGMADYPIDELDGKTPLEAARTPHMDYMAKNGKIGLASFVPKDMIPGSDVANLSIFGYDPHKYFSGRGPLEARNLGVELKSDEVAFRCNLITEEKDLLIDYSAGHILTKEALVLIKFLNRTLGDQNIHFYPGVSYRHLLVIKGNPEELLKLKCFPPHDIMGQKISKHLPRSETEHRIVELMEKSGQLLREHDINLVRIDLKENPANMIWLWGQGRKIDFPNFRERFGLTGSVISAVDLIKGIGVSLGLVPIIVPGATGYYDTNYEGKAAYALESLKERDFVFVHVEAPDEAGHNADVRAKISAIENFDRFIVGKVLAEYKKNKNMRIVVLPDHPTPIALRTHTQDPVCFVMYGKGVEKDKFDLYNERIAKESSFRFKKGHELMAYFVKKEQL